MACSLHVTMAEIKPVDTRWKLPQQDRVADLYNSTVVQVGVAVLIGANFLTNIVEKEIDPKGVKHADVFEVFNFIYNVAFTIELVANMYGHWFCAFWISGWNVFDSIVVGIGLINMMKLPLPSAFSMLRMMRAFRVFRLFKRVHSLNRIIVAIAHAVPGVLNAFFILFIVMSIYAILAVEFYYKAGDDCKSAHPVVPGMLTPRGFCFGYEYFGTFSRSFYSFFQVLTGESWSEMVARPAIWFYHNEPIKVIGGGFFFVSYVLVTAFMLINVVVAVLLDKMSDPDVVAKATEGAANADPDADGCIEDVLNSKDESVSNGVASDPVEPDSKEGRVAALQQKVAKLVVERHQMTADLDEFRSEMRDIKAKLGILSKVLSAESSSGLMSAERSDEV